MWELRRLATLWAFTACYRDSFIFFFYLITTHNQWLSKTRSIPYWTTSVFSSTVTDLVLIYESVTPSDSIVHWLTLHSWTLNHDSRPLLQMNHDDFSYTNESILVWVSYYDRRSVGQSVLEYSTNMGLTNRFYHCQNIGWFLMWGALSDERTDLLITIPAGPGQRSHFHFRVPWDSLSYFTLSDSRLPFSSPPTTRRASVEVFDPASIRDSCINQLRVLPL
jgi:hypothetical protein